MKHLDARAHVRGEAHFVDDLPEPPGTLHAAVVASEIAHGRITGIDPKPALACEGVVAVLTAQDVPGANQIGNVIQDEPLFADGEVHFRGQPVALVVARDLRQARIGAAAVAVEIEPLPGVFDPREAAAAGDLIAPARTIECGDVELAFAESDVVVDGRVESGGQEHIYLETQAALGLPGDKGRIRLLSATQGPTAVQRIAARVLGRPMNDFEIEVTRLGGAFGGKEDQATPWAVMAALAVHHLQQPVKIVLSRNEDCLMTGKRHPYSSDFRLGLRADGTILAYEVIFYQNAGAAADLSTAILGRSLFHATNSYYVPSTRITGYSCRTNLPPFTAFRGFGAPQAMFVFEAALSRAAEALGIERIEIQRKNLLRERDAFPYGMRVTNAEARRSFSEAEDRFEVPALLDEIAEHNAQHRMRKRGVAIMPVCFGISFTSGFLNQASALLHVYTDGSVSVSTAAVEMGQGVNTKIAGIVAHTLGIAADRIVVEATNTTRVANTSPTAASSGADMNGGAAAAACRMIVDRLTAVAAKKLGVRGDAVSIASERVLVDGEAAELRWNELVRLAYGSRVSLSAQAHYQTPGLHYDGEREQGRPFAYHVFGAAVVEATVDCLRGIYSIDRVRIVHDAGRSLNPVIDLGQVEGALAQGIGWMTVEELRFSEGRNLTDTLMAYKLPDLMATPDVETVFLEHADNPGTVLSSKAVGEPPLMYGIGAYFALMNAMRAFRPDREAVFDAPLTPEKVLMFLHSDRVEAASQPVESTEKVASVGGMNLPQVWRHAVDSLEQGGQPVLIFVVDHSGSVPGTTGATMVVSELGAAGTIGGGSVEHEMIDRARLFEGRPELVDWVHTPEESGSLCSGTHTLAMMALSDGDLSVLRSIVDTMAEEKTGVLRLSDDGLEFAAGGTAAPELTVDPRGWRFASTLGLIDTLTLVGGGHCCLALSRLMSTLPFRITVLDDRPELPTLIANRYAHETRIIDYEEVADHVPEGDRSWVVVMTYGHRFDGLVLRHLAGHHYRFLGLLGSQAKVQALFARLRSEGIPQEHIDEISAPVGLAIRSHTPEEIAVSIAAEIIQIRNA